MSSTESGLNAFKGCESVTASPQNKNTVTVEVTDETGLALIELTGLEEALRRGAVPLLHAASFILVPLKYK